MSRRRRSSVAGSFTSQEELYAAAAANVRMRPRKGTVSDSMSESAQRLASGSGDASRRIAAPVPTKSKPGGWDAGVNRNEGNPRHGKTFQTVKTARGDTHIYADGIKVFVPKSTRTIEQIAAAKRQRTAQRVAEERAKRPPRKGRRRVSMPG